LAPVLAGESGAEHGGRMRKCVLGAALSEAGEPEAATDLGWRIRENVADMLVVDHTSKAAAVTHQQQRHGVDDPNSYSTCGKRAATARTQSEKQPVTTPRSTLDLCTAVPSCGGGMASTKPASAIAGSSPHR